jgi:glyceraldehyde-3-phosphate dehydrogenase type I
MHDPPSCALCAPLLTRPPLIAPLVCLLVQIKDPACKLVAINTGADANYMAYQFKYDSVHGRFDGKIDVNGDDLIINGQTIKTTHTRKPEEIGWGKLGAHYICESTGAFLTQETCKVHLDTGAKKVVMSAPAKDDSLTIVMGVNEEDYKGQPILSCASCTTNGLAPIVKVVNDAFGIEEALMTTVHAFTATQLVVDGSSKKDWRGGRAASINIIPSSTGEVEASDALIVAVEGWSPGSSVPDGRPIPFCLLAAAMMIMMMMMMMTMILWRLTGCRVLCVVLATDRRCQGRDQGDPRA